MEVEAGGGGGGGEGRGDATMMTTTDVKDDNVTTHKNHDDEWKGIGMDGMGWDGNDE